MIAFIYIINASIVDTTTTIGESIDKFNIKIRGVPC